MTGAAVDPANGATTVWLVRHGETESYAADSGLTALGGEQSRARGAALSDAVATGPVHLVTARSNRARETAEQLRRGLVDRLPERAGDVPEPEPRAEFDNFAVATPSGRGEITAAHAEYADALERHRRAGTGPPPGWLVEIERFWAEHHGGGDPIRFWLTVPLLHFEPPAHCVRRFWSGVRRLVAGHPGAHLAVATHSGPIRAFATAALGRDLGEPRNAEVVVVRVAGDARTATVAYRGSAQDVRVPDAPPGWDGP